VASKEFFQEPKRARIVRSVLSLNIEKDFN